MIAGGYTLTGKKQAKKICKFLINNYKIDKIFSSDLKRAFHTAKPVAKKLKTFVNVDTRLREINIGDWDGENYDLLPNNLEYQKWQENMGTMPAPNGESFAQVLNRAKSVLEEIIANNDGKTILIATHGGVIRALQCYFANKRIDEITSIPWVPNASTTVINYDGKNFTYELNGYFKYLGNLLTVLPNSLK